ncbi:hypothetical protein BLNAU_11611 [Blattamonas nauphoetae]|uniref:Uncharacterized protein n=1 Tax=Blattamonas nauphoetae TaxID=2049346 RepID=A0ABQ9XN47_9EUKA|nr:hypothetical protein BLNAU_11611 [Blattamonas nauphoetae]
MVPTKRIHEIVHKSQLSRRSCNRGWKQRCWYDPCRRHRSGDQDHPRTTSIDRRRLLRPLFRSSPNPPLPSWPKHISNNVVYSALLFIQVPHDHRHSGSLQHDVNIRVIHQLHRRNNGNDVLVALHISPHPRLPHC